MVDLRVNELLKERGMTMTELAQKVGINRVNLYTSLNGNPTYERLKQVADALSVNVAELFKRNDEGVSICGFIEVAGKIYKINSLAELKDMVQTVEETLESQEKESKEE